MDKNPRRWHHAKARPERLVEPSNDSNQARIVRQIERGELFVDAQGVDHLLRPRRVNPS